MSGSKDILFVFYIRTNHLIASSCIFFQEFINMYKNNHSTKELNFFRKEFRDRQDISDEIQTSISLIRDELQTYIEKLISCIKMKDNFG